MALKKDKKKVLGEVFDDARVRGFLAARPPAGVNADFHCLERAYRGMNAQNFATFVEFFKADGRDLNAANPAGQSLLSLIAEHRHHAQYAAILRAAGAG
ncbi:MAG: PA4642 family protein [Cellvibrionales bacterium]|nr:PA4642 family protein [Cellvibrionales bacterium]